MIHFEAFMDQDGSLSIKSTGKKTRDAKAIENIVRNIYAGYNPKNAVANRLNKIESLIDGKITKFTPANLDLVCYYKTLMDPLLWEDIFFIPDQLHGLMEDDKPFVGTRIIYDEDGNPCKDKQGKIKFKQVSPKEATDDDIKNTIIKDYIVPAGEKLASIISYTDVKHYANYKPELSRAINDLETKLCSWGLTSVKTWYPLIKCPYKP
ncbi:hypothetical protein IKG48_01180 [Candidatus Saccharibacteria bacterium]|nr:hypothetical protein [Candidatus Saccharibacteria bacterium]